jgi:hypothetical protein
MESFFCWRFRRGVLQGSSGGPPLSLYLKEINLSFQIACIFLSNQQDGAQYLFLSFIVYKKSVFLNNQVWFLYLC